MIARLRTYASFVRFGHSVFALPFALAGALLASRFTALTWGRVGWIVLCMMAARSAAMGFNRLVDAGFDARNPRTAMRELPRGRMSRREAAIFVVLASAAFVLGAAQLGLVCLILSPVALAIVFWYSLAKRYTAHTQAFLGLAMAVAPVGGWIAAGGPARPEPWLLGLAIGAWVAGFDILYACQDVEFDRREGLRSVPERYGIGPAIGISRWLHALTVFALLGVGAVADLGWIYHIGVALVGVLLFYEQSLVRVDDLSNIKFAFDLNGWVGLLYFAATALDVYLV
jgi:4-hydroxybenzoate polyprenyltransferase